MSNNNHHNESNVDAIASGMSIWGYLQALYQQPATFFISYFFIFIVVALADWFIFGLYIGGTSYYHLGHTIKVEPYDPLLAFCMFIPAAGLTIQTCYSGHILIIGFTKLLIATMMLLWKIIMYLLVLTGLILLVLMGSTLLFFVKTWTRLLRTNG